MAAPERFWADYEGIGGKRKGWLYVDDVGDNGRAYTPVEFTGLHS